MKAGARARPARRSGSVAALKSEIRRLDHRVEASIVESREQLEEEAAARRRLTVARAEAAEARRPSPFFSHRSGTFKSACHVAIGSHDAARLVL